MKLQRYGIDAFDRLTAQDHGPLVYYSDVVPLLKAARAVLEGAESEGWDTYHGTDIPRTGIAELREAIESQ